MGNSIEQLEVSRKLFQDYVNTRDKVRREANRPAAVFNRNDEQIILTVARNHFRKRESLEFNKWLCSFFAETNMYFGSVKIQAWPLMRQSK